MWLHWGLDAEPIPCTQAICSLRKKTEQHGKPVRSPAAARGHGGATWLPEPEKTPSSPRSLPQELLLPGDSARPPPPAPGPPPLTPTHRESLSTKKTEVAPPPLDPSLHPRFPVSKRRGSICPQLLHPWTQSSVNSRTSHRHSPSPRPSTCLTFKRLSEANRRSDTEISESNLQR